MRISFGPFGFIPESQQLFKDGVQVPLTPLACTLLTVLMRHAPMSVSRSELANALSAGSFASELVLPDVVAELREALGDTHRRPRWIRTIRGFGYAFRGPIDHGGAEVAADGMLIPTITVPLVGATMKQAVRDLETLLIESHLHRARGVQAHAAALLGIKTTTLHEMMKRYGIRSRQRVEHAVVQACTVRQRARDVITAFPRSVLLREGEYIIGREARADVRVVNESVSLRHARLVMKDDMATVEDLGSQSGTYVGETRIGPPYPLYDGDEIRLGALVLTFRRVAKRRTA